MGETGAVSEDINSVYWNPAGLASINEKEISLMHAVWLETINHEYLALGFPTRFGNVGIAVNYLYMSEMDKYDNTGNKLPEKMSATDTALTLTYSVILQAYYPINVGVNVKYLHSKLENIYANAYATDIGAQTYLNNNLGFGIVFQNVGTKMRFIKEATKLPQNIKLGVTYKFAIPLKVAFDINLPNDSDLKVNLGTEYTMGVGRDIKLSPRLGYKSNMKGLEGSSGITVGVGFNFKDYCIDYAFVPYGQLGNTHNISLLMKFGKKEKKKNHSEPTGE